MFHVARRELQRNFEKVLLAGNAWMELSNRLTSPCVDDSDQSDIDRVAVR
jgi:hypothetical protein